MAKPGRFDWLFRPQLADEDRPLSAELRFAEALAELPAVERSALALSEIGGLDTDEIAERLGTDSATVRKLLARAREAVRTSLAVRGRGLTALVPFQSLWQLGSSAPALRTAGAVLAATAVMGPSMLVGRTAAEAQPVLSASPDPPRARALVRSDVVGFVPARARVSRAVAPAASPPAKPHKVDAKVERRRVPPVATPVAGPAPQPPAPVEPAGEQAAATPAPAPAPAAQPAAVAEAPVPVTLAPTVPPPPVELPIELPVELPPLPPPVPLPLPLP